MCDWWSEDTHSYDTDSHNSKVNTKLALIQSGDENYCKNDIQLCSITLTVHASKTYLKITHFYVVMYIYILINKAP